MPGLFPQPPEFLPLLARQTRPALGPIGAALIDPVTEGGPGQIQVAGHARDRPALVEDQPDRACLELVIKLPARTPGLRCGCHRGHRICLSESVHKIGSSPLRVIEALGQTRFQRDADDVAETVRRHEKGIKLSDLYRRHRRLKQRDFTEILSALEVQDRIRKVRVDTTTGRPPTIYITGREVVCGCLRRGVAYDVTRLVSRAEQN